MFLHPPGNSLRLYPHLGQSRCQPGGRPLGEADDKCIKAKELLTEGSKGADVNEGKFVLNIDALFVFNIL
jgi:hypothetical protein